MPNNIVETNHCLQVWDKLVLYALNELTIRYRNSGYVWFSVDDITAKVAELILSGLFPTAALERNSNIAAHVHMLKLSIFGIVDINERFMRGSTRTAYRFVSSNLNNRLYDALNYEVHRVGNFQGQASLVQNLFADIQSVRQHSSLEFVYQRKVKQALQTNCGS